MMRRGSVIGRLSLRLSRFQDASRESSTAAIAHAKLVETVDPEWESAKPYKLIPGPKPFPILGNVPRFLPGVGDYGKLSLAETVVLLRKRYGDIVKLEGIPGRRGAVFLFDPAHAEKVYRTEGPWPGRIAMQTMKLHRERRSDVFKGKYGLVVTQGKPWHDFRSDVNQLMMQPRVILPHIGQIDEVANDFIDKIRDLRDTESLEMPEFFNNEINKWALESICVIGFDHRMGCLEPNLPSDSEPQQLINNIHALFDLIYKLEILPSLWKYYETKDLKRFLQVLDNLTSITGKYVHQAMDRIAKEGVGDIREKSLLDKLLDVDEQTATIMAMDMLTAGVDTTSNSTATAIYQIARHPEAQERLRKEAYDVLPNKTSPVTQETLNNIPYVKAVIKETLRQFPIAVGNLRTMNSDIVIGGYRIPKGHDVIMCHSVMSQDPKNFPDEDKFIPERWLKECTTNPASAAHRFAYMPFGFGPRTCIGRRFAQVEMETFLIKLVRNFRMEWHHEPLVIHNKFINTVGSPLRVKLIDI